MKPNVLKIIKMDYLSKLLFIISLVALLILIVIITIAEGAGIGTGIVLLIGALALFVLRLMSMITELTNYSGDKTLAIVKGTMVNNGLLYISYGFEYNGAEYSRRVPFLCGPLKKIKLSKLTEVNVVFDKENPKKSHISDFFY